MTDKAACPVLNARRDYPNVSVYESKQLSGSTATQFTEALDEIDRLRAEVEQLRGSQHRYLSALDNTDGPA